MDDLGSLKENFRELYAEKQVSDGLIVIFSHPCMFITETFWDSVNFHDGKNPIEGRYVSPPLRSKEAYNESLKAFEKFLEYILGFPNVKIVTFKEIPNVYHEPEERMLSLDKILSVAEEVTIRDNWQIVNGISVSPAEVLRLLTELILNYLSRGDEPESIPIRFTLGPTSKPSELGVRRTVRLRSFLSLCYRTKEFMEEHDKIPSTLSEGNFAYGPGDLLAAAAMAVTFYSEFRRLPSEIKIGKASNLPDVVERWNLASRVKSQWKWIIFSRDFNSHKIEDLTIGQSWTIRPAVLS